MDNEQKGLARIFKALGDENRLKILALVHQSELDCACGENGCDEARCMTQLVELLGISQATVSHHVKELVNAGLVVTTRKGKWIHCHVDDEGVERACAFLTHIQARQTTQEV